MTTASPELIPGLGVLRVSEDAGRSAKGKLHSLDTQKEAIERDAEKAGIRIDDWYDETNVSGGTPLEARPYGRAIGRVEDGSDPAKAIVFAYSSRHDRSIEEGRKAIERMDSADGILLVGGQTLSHATPDEWRRATLNSFMSEDYRRTVKWASRKGVEKAVSLGRVPYPSVPLGFHLNDDNTIRLADEATRKIVREAFQLRADGATIDEVRAYLAEHGYVRTYRAVQRLLKSPLYVGEIRYGTYVNDDPGFGAIVEREVWEKVQAMRSPRGRHSKSPRLLARQGVLICGGCGGRMIAGIATAPNGREVATYRCGRGRACDCPKRAAIVAEPVEELISAETRRILSDATGRAAAVREAQEARAKADVAAKTYSRARRRLVIDEETPDDEAIEILAELRDDRDAKAAHAKALEDDCEEVELVNAARRWDELTIGEMQRLIKATFRRVVVRPGRGGTPRDRCTFEPKRKQAASSAV
jgi:Recombinase/Resolvase, N terminal domain